MKIAIESLWNLDTFIAWLRTKDPSARYNYCTTKDCLVAQYVKEHMDREICVGPKSIWFWTGKDWERNEYPDVFDEISEGSSWTYGQALDRALAVKGHKTI